MGRVRKHSTIDGRTVSYLEAGREADPSLVLLHAFPLSADMWAPQLASPPPGWRVVAPDFRGFGESDGDRDVSVDAGLSIDDYARDVLGLVAALRLDRVVVGGLSLGGYVVFALRRLLRAAPAPPAVGGLVLADTRAQADTADGRAARLKMADLVDAQGPAGVVRAVLSKLVDEGTRRRPAAVEAVRAMMLAARPDAIKAALYRMMSRPDSSGDLAAIDTPTLVIVGDRDALTPPDLSREMHACIPDSTLAIVPDAGHISNLEQPEIFARALNGFLDRL